MFLSINTLSSALHPEILSVLALTITLTAFNQSASSATYKKLLPLPLISTAQVALSLTNLIKRSPPRGTIKSIFSGGFFKKSCVSSLFKCNNLIQSFDNPFSSKAWC